MTVSILQTKDPAINAVDLGLRERYVKAWNAYVRVCERSRPGVVDTKLTAEREVTYRHARDLQEEFDRKVKKAKASLGIPEEPDPDAVPLPGVKDPKPAKAKKRAA